MDFSLSKEQMDIKKAAGEFARGEFKPEIAQECELNHRFPRELYQKAGELGFIGLDYPEDLGGGGMGVFENVLVVEEFCKVDSGIGMAIHLGYLPAKIVRILRTPEQEANTFPPWSKVSGCPPFHSPSLIVEAISPG
jgi:alkylation response protein AidB-like acyl-CoA dehydrogenase